MLYKVSQQNDIGCFLCVITDRDRLTLCCKTPVFHSWLLILPRYMECQRGL